MTSLTFTKNGVTYDAEYKADYGFNLHLELPKTGVITVLASSLEDGRKKILNLYIDHTMDKDIVSDIYPKYYLILCTEPVTSCNLSSLDPFEDELNLYLITKINGNDESLPTSDIADILLTELLG